MKWIKSWQWKKICKKYQKTEEKKEKYKILLKLHYTANTFNKYHFLYQKTEEYPKLKKSSFLQCQKLCHTFEECKLVYNIKPTLKTILKLIQSAKFFYQYAYILENCMTLHAVGLTKKTIEQCISLAKTKIDWKIIYDNTQIGSEEWRLAQKKLNIS